MPARPTANPRFRDAYERHLPEMLALPASAVRTVNLDIPTAGQIVLGVLPKLEAHREALLRLSDGPAQAVGELESLTRAMVHAHTRWVFASMPAVTLGDLVSQGIVMRRSLASAARFFAEFGIIDRSGLVEIDGRTGHRKLAMDLLGLVAMLRPALETAQRGTPLTATKLEAAESLGEEILTVLGEQQLTVLGASEANQLRYRAFTLFSVAYDQVQRGILYLRWSEGDARSITPSIHGGGGAKRRRAVKQPPAESQPAVNAGAPDQAPSRLEAEGQDGAS